MNSKENSPIVIDYYSDILCVWAWIAQPRLEQVHKQWGKRVSVRHRCVDIFGDAWNKIAGRWGAANGFEKFSAHVAASVRPFDPIAVHPDLWTAVVPRSSMPAHLLLKAVELVGNPGRVESMALRIRRAFFEEAQDVGDVKVLQGLAAEQGLDSAALDEVLGNGSAMAALSDDLRRATDSGVRGSPTWVLNEGRQILYGNVGYRILHANIEELLHHPVAEASWC